MDNPLRSLFEKEGSLICKQGEDPYFRLLSEELMGRFSPGTALDVGCGTGDLVYFLRQSNCDAFGVDIADSCINLAHNSIRNFLKQGDIDFNPLPFNDETFDLVICSKVLQHLQRPGYVVSQMWRVLKNEKIAFIVAIALPWESNLIEKLLKRDPQHIHDHASSLWIKVFEMNGFEYIGNMQGFIRETAAHGFDPPPVQMGLHLRRTGPFGKWIWPSIACLYRKALLFRKRRFHKLALNLAK